MREIYDLGGIWSLRCQASPLGAIDVEGVVPGCVHTDLINNRIIENIFYRDNAKKIQWIENCDFTYTKRFRVNRVRRGAYLEFDGLDTYADIYLNHKRIGQADDMFVSHEFCVDGILCEGENILEVRFFSPIKRVEGMPLYHGAFTQERMNTRRVQCTYSWDWVDRFVTMGIYRDVRLCFRGKNEVDHFYIYTSDINSYAAQIKMDINIRDFEDCGDTVSIQVTSPSGETVFAKERTLISPSLHETIDIVDPELWYPVGYGEQPLYTVRIATATSSQCQTIGIRKVTVLQIIDDEGSEYRKISLALQKEPHLLGVDLNSSTSGFVLLVNGIKIMCKGGNWVPCEPFPSAESPEKITRLLEMAVASGVNMIRVWGGGIFERDEFYAECDRLGILVTQDFLMACGNYPEHETWFIEALKRETQAAALRLRNHPCLVYWCGDNENAVLGSENRTDFSGYRSATYGIQPILARLDPHRYFFPSSPYGGDNYCSATCGTTHVTYFLGSIFDYMNSSDMKDYRTVLSKFYSRFCCEYPAFGMSFASSLEKYMDHSDVFYDTTMEMIEYHSKDNPSLDKPLFRMYNDTARKIFGNYRGGEDALCKYRMLHCELIRLSMELYRRYKGYSWGLVYWMLNDCWPAAAGWSLIDYYACPKPAYYAFKRSAQPVIASVWENEGTLSLYVCNDSLRHVSGNARLYVYDFKSNVDLHSIDLPFSIGENRTDVIYTCDFSSLEPLLSESTILLCDLTSDIGEDRAFFVKDRFADLDIQYSNPIIVKETDDEITVTVDSFHPFVMLDVPYLLSENCFPLKRGEIRIVKKIGKLSSENALKN